MFLDWLWIKMWWKLKFIPKSFCCRHRILKFTFSELPQHPWFYGDHQSIITSAFGHKRRKWNVFIVYYSKSSTNGGNCVHYFFRVCVCVCVHCCCCYFLFKHLVLFAWRFSCILLIFSVCFFFPFLFYCFH